MTQNKLKRVKLEIIKDILKIIQDNKEIRITPLIRKSNISSSRFYEYFQDLLQKQLIIQKTNSKTGKVIALSEKGNKFLEKYKTIISFIEEFELWLNF